MTKEIHDAEDVCQRYTRFGFVRDLLSSNFGIKDLKSKFL